MVLIYNKLHDVVLKAAQTLDCPRLHEHLKHGNIRHTTFPFGALHFELHHDARHAHGGDKKTGCHMLSHCRANCSSKLAAVRNKT